MQINLPKRGASAAYLVLLNQAVVSQNLAGAIVEHSPGASVLLAETPDEALTALATVGRLSVAFVGMSPRDFAGSDLARAVAARSERAVLIGDEAETSGPSASWQVLPRPFTTEIVLRFLDPRPLRLVPANQ